MFRFCAPFCITFLRVPFLSPFFPFLFCVLSFLRSRFSFTFLSPFALNFRIAFCLTFWRYLRNSLCVLIRVPLFVLLVPFLSRSLLRSMFAFPFTFLFHASYNVPLLRALCVFFCVSSLRSLLCCVSAFILHYPFLSKLAFPFAFKFSSFFPFPSVFRSLLLSPFVFFLHYLLLSVSPVPFLRSILRSFFRFVLRRTEWTFPIELYHEAPP